MTLALVYYSKTGKTRVLVEFISRRFKELGVAVEVFALKPVREYSDKFLHLNPRVLYESMSGRAVPISGDEGFEPSKYDAVLISTPIWWGTAAPPIHSFILKYANTIKLPVYCIATADLQIDYALKLRKSLETRGYEVRDCITVRSLEEDVDRINLFINNVMNELTKT